MSERHLKITPHRAVATPPNKPAGKITISGLHKKPVSSQDARATRQTPLGAAGAADTQCGCHGGCTTPPSRPTPKKSAF